MANKVTILGRIGKEPELKYMATGDSLVTFTVATDFGVKRGDKFENITSWWRCTMFGKRAEKFNEYAAKGAMILVEGRLNLDPETGAPRTYTDKDGKVRATLEMVVSDFTYIGQIVKKAEKQEEGE